MNYIRAFALVQVALLTVVGGGVVMDPQVQSAEIKVALIIAIPALWVGLGSWRHIWKRR